MISRIVSSNIIRRVQFHVRVGALETNARSRVERTFKVFPYTRSTTTIFEMQDLESLQKMMIDEEMTEEDLAECRKVSLKSTFNSDNVFSR